jgi:PKD repeat protein
MVISAYLLFVKMKKALIYIVLLTWCSAALGQEICNNGIDDDGDGLIDLFDEDCNCIVKQDIIPNPSFEDTTACPPSFSQYNYPLVQNWQVASTLFSYYNFACDPNSYNNTGIIQTVPAGVGMIILHVFNGFAFNNGQNYQGSMAASTCLTDTLFANSTYRLKIKGSFSSNMNIYGTMPNIKTLELYGKPTCTAGLTPSSVNPWSNSIDYLTNLDPNWQFLSSDTFSVAPTVWEQFELVFTPTVDMTSIAVTGLTHAQALTQDNGYVLFIDDLELFEILLPDTITLNETGLFCTANKELTASVNLTGGTWQWFKDSVALVGETNASLNLTNYGTGEYTVQYSINGNCGTVTTTVFQDPEVVASMTIANGCQNDSLLFEADAFLINNANNAASITNYQWDFGDGNTSTAEDTIHLYQNSGNYTVTLITEANFGCNDTISQTITVHPKPMVSFLSQGNCLADSVNFTDMSTISSGTIDNLTWDFGNNQSDADSLETVLYNTTGNYAIQLKAESDHGCLDSLMQTIYINAKPLAQFTANDTCEGSAINFSSTSTIPQGNITNYTWHFGDNNVGAGANINHSYANAGNYLAQLTVVSDSGCVDSTNFNITIHPNPLADFSATASCFLANFTNLSSIISGNINNYLWNFGDMNSSNLASPENRYSANGNYNVTLTATSDFGCTASTTKPLTIFNNFEADFTASADLICQADCIEFSNQSTATDNHVSVKYYWEINGETSTQENPEFCFTQTLNEATAFDVFFKIETSAGCIDSILKSAALTVIPKPDAQFSFTPSSPTIESPEVQFINESTQATNFIWNFGDNAESSEIDPVHTYLAEAKSYTVTLTATDATKTCTDRYSRTLVVEDQVLFFIPNAFSPGSGSLNETFQPVFVSGIDIYQFHFQIFNRNGELVFESFDPQGAWDGFYGSKLVDIGVYIWKVEFVESQKDKTHTKTGTVTVLR